jgi:metallo-beta-lactamase family protein
MFQGRGKDTDPKNRHFRFDPMEVDALVLSHAHIDHSGLIPRLVKEGFDKPIWCTPGTLDLLKILLYDSAHIQESDAAFLNKFRIPKGKKPIEPLYNSEDVGRVFPLIQELPYNEEKEILPDVWLTYTDAGHILGAAVVNLKIKEGYQTYRLTFTGDIGRYDQRIMKDPQPFPQCDFLLCETTYGDRDHIDSGKVKEKLREVVYDTCVNKGGKLLIPAFSVGRTQEILSLLNDLQFEGKLPKIPVFVDSPLSINATEIMKKHPEAYNERLREFMEKDPDPFGFAGLNYVNDVEESKALNVRKEPCIIVSASGMMEGGRIKHHLIHSIENPQNTLLIVGYCTPSSLGGALMRGMDEVKIYGRVFNVKMEVCELAPLSAHGDRNEIMRFLSCQDPLVVKKTFLIHGDEEARQAFAQQMEAAGWHNIVLPRQGQSFELG